MELRGLLARAIGIGVAESAPAAQETISVGTSCAAAPCSFAQSLHDHMRGAAPQRVSLSPASAAVHERVREEADEQQTGSGTQQDVFTEESLSDVFLVAYETGLRAAQEAASGVRPFDYVRAAQEASGGASWPSAPEFLVVERQATSVTPRSVVPEQPSSGERGRAARPAGLSRAYAQRVPETAPHVQDLCGQESGEHLRESAGARGLRGGSLPSGAAPALLREQGSEATYAASSESEVFDVIFDAEVWQRLVAAAIRGEPVLQSGGAGSSFGGKAGASHASAAAGVSAGAAFQGATAYGQIRHGDSPQELGSFSDARFTVLDARRHSRGAGSGVSSHAGAVLPAAQAQLSAADVDAGAEEHGTESLREGERAGVERAFEGVAHAREETAQSQGIRGFATTQAALSAHIRAHSAELAQSGRVVLRDHGRGYIDIALKPEHLGAVSIRLALSENKRVVGTIHVASQEAFEAFQENLGDLARAFEANGFDAAQFDVQWFGAGAHAEDGHLASQTAAYAAAQRLGGAGVEPVVQEVHWHAQGAALTIDVFA